MSNLVSVVIPTIKGREKLLKRAIASVKNQTYKNIEIIVVDEGKSSPEQRNIGMERAKGDYIALLDDDDIWLPQKIEKQVDVMNSDENIGLVTCYSLNKRFGMDRITKPSLNPTYKDLLKSFNLSSTSSFLIRKSVIDDIKQLSITSISRIIDKRCGRCERQHICWADYTIGIWSEKDLICPDIRKMLENQHMVFDVLLPSAQEYDLALRIAKKYKIGTVPEVLMVQNASENQISKNWDKKIRGIMVIYRKYHSDYRLLGYTGSILNHIKVAGLIFMFWLGNIFGDDIYRILYPLKKIYEGEK